MPLPITTLFAKLPIGPIQQHMKKTQECAGQLPDFLAASLRDDCKEVAKIHRKISQLEHDLPPVKVMFMYNVIDWIGELADGAQIIDIRFQMLLAR